MENLFQVVLRSLLKHPVETIIIGSVAFKFLQTVFKGKQREAAGEAAEAARIRRRTAHETPAGTDTPSPNPTRESELEARVRRNFEEMMRRRAPAKPASTAAKPIAPPHRPPRPVVDYDEQARPEPTKVVRKKHEAARPHSKMVVPRSAPKREFLGVEAFKHSALVFEGSARRRSARLTAYKLPQLRGQPLDRDALRRAILLREILETPVGLR